MGLARAVHLHLARPRAASHADVLQAAAKAGGLVALKVGQADENVRIHNGGADLGLLHIVAVNGHQGFIGALQAVADEHMAAGGEGGKAVFIGGVQMVQCVFPAAHIQGVAVGKEGFAPQFLHHISHHFGVIGPQEGQVPRLAEMDLDGGVFVLKVNVPDPRFLDELFQLLQ